MKTPITLLTATVLSLSPAWADEAPYGEPLAAAHQLYLAGSEGDKEAVDRAEEALRPLHEQRPADPMTLALLGGVHTLQGRDAWMPWNKLSYTEDGLAELHKAVQLLEPQHDQWWFGGLPVSLQVKSLAGITFTEVPDFFGRFEQGYQLLLECSQSPLLDGVEPAAQSHLHFFAAKAAEQADEQERYRQLIRRLADLPVEDEYTRSARERLAEWEG